MVVDVDVAVILIPFCQFKLASNLAKPRPKQPSDQPSPSESGFLESNPKEFSLESSIPSLSSSRS